MKRAALRCRYRPSRRLRGFPRQPRCWSRTRYRKASTWDGSDRPVPVRASHSGGAGNDGGRRQLIVRMLGLPAASYLDPAAALAERERIFHRSWQFVCHVSDLPAPGTAIRFDCAGTFGGGPAWPRRALHGFRNACRHRGSRLVDGDAHTGSRFASTLACAARTTAGITTRPGRWSACPSRSTYPALERADMALQPVHVAQWRGLVFVAFDKPALALADGIDASAPGQGTAFAALRRLGEPRTHATAGGLEARLRASARCVASRGRASGVEAAVVRPGALCQCGAFAVRAVRWHGAQLRLRRAGQCARTRKFLPAVTPRVMEAIFVWPNLLLQFMPDQLAVVQVLPAATGTCSLREVSYGVPDASRELRVARYASARVRRARARSGHAGSWSGCRRASPAVRSDRAAAARDRRNRTAVVRRAPACSRPRRRAAKPVRRRRMRNPAPLPGMMASGRLSADLNAIGSVRALRKTP